MSSYLYDPHSIRQKPNRYYQRKGQIIRAKHNDIINQAISKEDAERYKQAVYNYFPIQVDEQSTHLEYSNQINLSEIPLTSVITSYKNYFNINENNEGFRLMLTTNKQPQSTITSVEARQFTWLATHDLDPDLLAYLRTDGILDNINSTKPTAVYRYGPDGWEYSIIQIDTSYNLVSYYYQLTTLKKSTETNLVTIYTA